MDCSIVAIESDVIRDGKPVVGYGFNSNGRYSAGEILRRRVLPRLLEAEPGSLLDERGGLDHAKAWDVMMRNENPGGHGERSVDLGHDVVKMKIRAADLATDLRRIEAVIDVLDGDGSRLVRGAARGARSGGADRL